MDRNSQGARAFIARRNANNIAAEILTRVVDEKPAELSESFISRVKAGLPDVPEEEVYASVLESVCGLDPESSERDSIIAEEYIDKCVRRLDADQYNQNPFLVNIHVPESGSRGEWEFDVLRYKPYEIFPLGQSIVGSEYFTEIPLMGYFDKPFSCPVVRQGGREWMAVKPSEILTMEEPLEHAKGSICVFGLGIGYFAYMASLKHEVTDITIVEIDADAIRLFKDNILPQFEHPEKITVVKADAFDYVVRNFCDVTEPPFDYAFVDLWHDVSDGVPMYEKFLKLLDLKRNSEMPSMKKKISFDFWIEPLLRSNRRWSHFYDVLDAAEDVNDLRNRLFIL